MHLLQHTGEESKRNIMPFSVSKYLLITLISPSFSVLPPFMSLRKFNGNKFLFCLMHNSFKKVSNSKLPHYFTLAFSAECQSKHGGPVVALWGRIPAGNWKDTSGEGSCAIEAQPLKTRFHMPLLVFHVQGTQSRRYSGLIWTVQRKEDI